jgi:signal transduction histidine kinase
MAPSNETTESLRERVLADLGELVGPLIHEFNNLLNSLTLHMALWEQKQPVNLVEDLADLRKHIKQVVGLTGQMQDRRRSVAGMSGACVLDDILRAELANPELVSVGQNTVRIHADLASAGSETLLTKAEARRLCRFLVHNAMRAALQGGGDVFVRTTKQAATVSLIVEDNGPNVPAPLLVRVFEPTFDLRSGVMGLEMASCRSLVTRTGGAIVAREREGGGLVIEAQLAGPKS